jgi:DNA mismatch repair protein MutH
MPAQTKISRGYAGSFLERAIYTAAGSYSREAVAWEYGVELAEVPHTSCSSAR